MAKDKRIKGCPNENCEQRQKKIKYKSSDEYCPKCGSRLIFVCNKCFSQIEDIDPSHKICKRCEAESQEKKDKVIDIAKGVAAAAGSGVLLFGTNIVHGIANNIGKDIKKEAVDIGTKAIKDVVANIISKK